MGDYLPTKLGFDDGELVAAVCLPGDYSGFMLFAYENGKVGKVALSAYDTKSNRRKLTGAYSDKSPLKGILCLREDADVVLYSTDGRALVLNSALLSVKSTRSTIGVAALTEKESAAGSYPAAGGQRHSEYQPLSQPQCTRSGRNPQGGRPGGCAADYGTGT